MGFFSWKTQDTKKSIPNLYQNVEPTFPVTMIDDKGNKYYEPKYDGYGVFGGKDFYVLMAEMNGIEGINDEELRQKAINLAFSDKLPENIKFPNLVENPNNWTYIPTEPETCEFQGFFYADTDIYGEKIMDEDTYIYDDTYNDDDSY